jgi:Niemann-Pick C1 protein
MQDCRDSVRKAFDVWEALEGLDGYAAVCQTQDYNCPWSSITQFFNNSREVFEDADFQSNEECLVALSAPFFPNGEFVLTTKIFGYPVYDETTSVLTSAESTFHILGFSPDEKVRDAVVDLETEAVDVLFNVADQWKADGSSPSTIMEQFNESAFALEFGKGFLENIPFMIAAFTLMAVFTAVIFFKRDAVESRMAVGVGATVSVTLGMAASFGLMFICGIPMTSIHGILPYIAVGVGLDDALIIANEFYRLPRSLSVEERVSRTMNEIGLSIVTTTLTSAVAFGLGCTSSIPAVYWLCLYACPAITAVFFYTVTMFVAIIVIDERRVEERRRDMMCCLSTKTKASEMNDNGNHDVEGHQDSMVDRLMVRYANVLMQPLVKGVVLVVFSAIFAVCAWSTTLLKQEFTIQLVLPQGSYVVTFLDSFEIYTSFGGLEATLYFRDMDQSTLEGQQAMENYLNDMVAMKEVSSQPDHFWVRDFRSFSQNNSAIEGLTFEEQLAVFLGEPVFHALYDNDIARNEQGQVTASRILVRFDELDKDDVKGQIDALQNQERVARQQPINNGVAGKDWRFFSFDDFYFIWSFFKACPSELSLSTITGCVAVTLISIIAIPHWSAVFFSAPLVIILYIDLLGFLQFAGVTINSVSYITLTLSIGLMVDFLIHILLRYFESTKKSRLEKIKDTLESMGASVALGGFTTLLGVLPLAFNTTGIFQVVFVTFIGLVVLGVGHGLVLLPVLLSICGPEDNIVSLLKEDNDEIEKKKPETKRGLTSGETDGSE